MVTFNENVEVKHINGTLKDHILEVKRGIPTSQNLSKSYFEKLKSPLKNSVNFVNKVAVTKSTEANPSQTNIFWVLAVVIVVLGSIGLMYLFFNQKVKNIEKNIGELPTISIQTTST